MPLGVTEGSFSGIEPAALVQELPVEKKSFAVSGVAFDRCAEVLDGGVAFAALYESDGEPVARIGAALVTVESFLVVLDGLRDPDGTDRNIIWLVLLLLGDKAAAVEELKQYESAETPQTIASWLVYHKFDPSPYPVVMDILEREGVQRPPAAEMPYTCPPE